MTRSHILQSWGYNLQDGADYASLSLQVLEGSTDNDDDRVRTRLLADAYRYQGIAAIYMGSDVAVPSCKRWIGLLVERIEKYQDQVDIMALPIAYNEIGMALMRVPDKDAAIKSWVMSCDTLAQVTKPGDLPFPFPWVHRALVSAYSGDPDSGDKLLAPVLQEREKKLGVDDTSTIEYGSFQPPPLDTRRDTMLTVCLLIGPGLSFLSWAISAASKVARTKRTISTNVVHRLSKPRRGALGLCDPGLLSAGPR